MDDCSYIMGKVRFLAQSRSRRDSDIRFQYIPIFSECPSGGVTDSTWSFGQQRIIWIFWRGRNLLFQEGFSNSFLVNHMKCCTCPWFLHDPWAIYMESVLFFNDFMMVIRNLRAKLLPILTKNLNILEIIFRMFLQYLFLPPLLFPYLSIEQLICRNNLREAMQKNGC